jgi:prophage regulatory protein
MKFTVQGEPKDLFLPVEVTQDEMRAFMLLAKAAESAAPEPAITPAVPERLVREKEVLTRVPLSRTTLWRRVRAGSFPAPRIIGKHSKAWLESQIADWLEAQPDKTGLLEPKQLRRARKVKQTQRSLPGAHPESAQIAEVILAVGRNARFHVPTSQSRSRWKIWQQFSRNGFPL